MYNQTTVVGRIAQPEVKSNRAGKTFIRIGIACANGKEESNWANVIIGGKFAEIMATKLNKGQLVFCTYHSSQNKGQDGKTYTNNFCDTLRILKDSEQQQNAGGQQQPQGQAQQPQANEGFDDDIPF